MSTIQDQDGDQGMTVWKEYRQVMQRFNRRPDWEDENWRLRFNSWPGRGPEGKKLAARLGEKPFPWEGAADSAPPVIDSCIREDVDMCMEALHNAKIEAVPMEPGDIGSAAAATTVLRYYVKNKMRDLPREKELAANIFFETGKLALGITWQREVSTSPSRYTLDKFDGLVGTDGVTPIAKILLDPSRLPEAIQLAINFHEMECKRLVGECYTPLTQSQAEECLSDIRNKGECEFPMPYFSKNHPRICAYRYGYDFFRTNQSMHLQDDRYLFCREFITEDQLEAGVIGFEWSRDAVDEIKKLGKGKYTAPYLVQSPNPGTMSTFNINGTSDSLNYKDSFEIVHAYHKEADKHGVLRVVYKVFCPSVQSDGAGNELFLKNETLTYEHGEYPFVDEPLEVTSRQIESSRGYGEVLGSAQRQIKAEIDSRIDRASMTTLPPLTYPHGREPGDWGPGKRYPRMRPDDYTFVEIPQYDRVSEVVEASAYRQIKQWLGRADETLDPVYSTLRKQRLVKKWLGIWRDAFFQVFKLIQQNADDEIVVRVTGNKNLSFHTISREEIQGEFDVDITFNALSYDNEVRKQNLEYLEKMIQIDAGGTIDRNGAVNLGLSIIDPEWAQTLVRPAPPITQMEIDDTKNVYAQIFAGLQVDVKPGQNYQLRSQVLKELVFGIDPDTGEPKNPMALQRLKNDPQFKANLERYSKQLDFQLEQQRNAQIGRLGA